MNKEPEITIDIYKVINGIYRSNVLVKTLEIEDASQSTEIDLFCALNNCYYDDTKQEDVLYCNLTNAPIYWLR